MPRKNSYITVTDQFCGAGGSSQGVRRVAQKHGGGLEVKQALNHWKLAIDTHNTNFPDTIHDCTDISACDPRRYYPTDILITSPECTNHSLAKGVKIAKKQMDLFNSGKVDAAAERSRATMWDVVRFAECHDYNIIIVENVVDARKWVLFDSWLTAMHNLGYMHKSVYLNSMHCHPTPQSRDRMYIVFWKKGNHAPDLEFRPLAYCEQCETDTEAIQTFKNKQKAFGKYRQQYVYCCPKCSSVVEPYYYAAFNCIDWSDRGTRIGDRKKPLSDNTIRRIEYGRKKFGNDPMIIHTAYGKKARNVYRSAYQPAFTQTTFKSQAIINPFIVDTKQTSGVDCRVKSVGNVTPTFHTQPAVGVCMPMIIKGEHTKQEGMVRNATQPFQTQLTRQSMSIATPPPFIVELKKSSNARAITKPLSCATTVGYHGLITNEAFSSFIHYHYGSTTISSIDSALGTATTKDRHSLVSYDSMDINDYYYRMLKPHEIKLAMAFDNDYTVLGSGKDQVKQLGNAVTPPAMEWLVEQCIKSLERL